MNRMFTLFVSIWLGISSLISGSKCQNPDSVIVAALEAISTDSVQSYVQQLQDMNTRFMIAPNRKDVASWIRDKFYSFGITEVRLDSFLCYSNINWPPLVYDTSTWQYNVEAKITGISLPDEEIVMIGHYDCVVQDGDPMIFAPGADDNASGVAAEFECARVIMELGFMPERTIIFMASAAEELMYYGDAGTEHYAAEAQAAGREIVMAINNDMIAWNDGSWTVDLFNHSLSPNITSLALTIIENYTTLNSYSFQPVLEVGGDIQPFLDAGYQGIYFMEHLINPNYHKITDVTENCDFLYLSEVTKVSLGMILYTDIFSGDDKQIITLEKLNIFPNPAGSSIGFELNVKDYSTTYEIVNITGAEILSGKLNPGLYHRICTEHLKDGIYSLRINHPGRFFYEKFVRQ